MTEQLICLEHVNVARGNRQVLYDIGLRLDAGRHLAILGPNGCGKSTLLKTLTCELYPIAGPDTNVQLFGRSRWDVSELRRRLGVVSSDPVPHTMREISGTEAVLTGFFGSSRIWPNLIVTDRMRDRAERLMSRVGVMSLATRLVGTMSSGEQRKILIARALAGTSREEQRSDSISQLTDAQTRPEMLLLDEPSNNLDLVAQRDLRHTLRGLARAGTSLLLITHHVADIIPEIRHVLLLREGRVFRAGAREELLTSAVLSELFQSSIEVVERDGTLAAL